MKSLEELEQIVNTYSGGPILSVAAKELVKLCKAYREFGCQAYLKGRERKHVLVSDEELYRRIDAEARRVAETL